MDLLEHSIVRIFYQQTQEVIGAGFLISKTHVLTCAHVIQAALGTAQAATISSVVRLQFPFLPSTFPISAKAVLLSSPSADGDDLAVLEMLQDLPNDAFSARLVDIEKADQEDFKVYGFPNGYPNGLWASGVLRGKVANGRVQIEDFKQTGYFIEPGFSGTAVWSDKLGGVLGMVVSADTDRTARMGFMIPTDRIRRIIGTTLPEFQSVYYPPVPKKEALLSNLLAVQSFTPRLYVAVATKNTAKNIIRLL